MLNATAPDRTRRRLKTRPSDLADGRHVSQRVATGSAATIETRRAETREHVARLRHAAGLGRAADGPRDESVARARRQAGGGSRPTCLAMEAQSEAWAGHAARRPALLAPLSTAAHGGDLDQGMAVEAQLASQTERCFLRARRHRSRIASQSGENGAAQIGCESKKRDKSKVGP
jgi:hypothetical protein